MKRAIHLLAENSILNVKLSTINRYARALIALRETHLLDALMSAKLITIVVPINTAITSSARTHAISVERELNVMASAIIDHNASVLRIILEVHLLNAVLSAMVILIALLLNLLVSMEVSFFNSSFYDLYINKFFKFVRTLAMAHVVLMPTAIFEA